MTRIGLCSISALDRPLADAAAVAAEAGLDGLEVTQRPPHLDEDASPETARAAGRAVRAAGVEVLAYGSYLGLSGSRSLERARREVALAEALETSLLRVWAETLPDRPDAGLAEVAKVLRTACDAAEAAGIQVVAERHVGSFADTPERIEQLFAAVDRPNFALNYQVLDFLPPDAVAAQPDDARLLIPRARYFHLKNYRPNPQAGGRLAPGGSLAGGELDYRAILAAAFEAGYSGPMGIEFLSFEPLSLEQKLAADVEFLRSVLRELGQA